MFSEVKEHATGRLHQIFTDPYSAFDNLVTERHLHLQVALQELVGKPMAEGRLILRLLYGWENGNCEPAELLQRVHHPASLNDLKQLSLHYQEVLENAVSLPGDEPSLLAAPLKDAISAAEAGGQVIDDETRTSPSRWPAFEGGLLLYTHFKVYHRLIYGEDDCYRSIHCKTSLGPREVHEFHLEEGDFAVASPVNGVSGESILLLHISQLEPILQLLESSGVGS